KTPAGGGSPVTHSAAAPTPQASSSSTGSKSSTPQAGGLPVTIEQLRAVMTTLPPAKASLYLAPLNQAMVEFHITTRLRKAAFLGQVAHESGELKWFHEFASGMEYDISRNPKKAKEL